MKPGKSDCCKFYKNVALIPFYIHHTDEHGERKISTVIACSEDTASNFAVCRHLLLKVIEKYASVAGGCRRVVVITDNCCKQHRNRMNYGFVADFCYELGLEMELLFEEQYHGKCIVDAMCALLKVLARQEAVFKDSKITRRGVIYSHAALAKLGREKFGMQRQGSGGS